MSDRLTTTEALDAVGLTLEEVMHDALFGDAVGVPTLCPQYCETDPDGCCPHGHPSVLLAEGLI